MVRLGLHLTLRSGREGLVRLVITMVAVAVGVGLLLSVLAMYHAYRSTTARSCWECTDQASATGSLWWNYSQDTYAGEPIKRLDVAALTPDAPSLPGLARMPAAGRYYASPALAKLLTSVPRDQLGARFPGTPAGLIGEAALQSPDELAIVVGRPAADMRALPQAIQINTIQTLPRTPGTSQIYRLGFALGAAGLLVPMLLLIGNATRIAAARREERYAAMRLVGGTRGQIGVIAAVEALVGAAAGAALGAGVFAVLRPWLSRLPLLGFRFFPDAITPTRPVTAAVLILVPVAAALASIASLRRVGISPLGVARRTTPPAPRVWRVIPLIVALGLFCIPLATDPERLRTSPEPAVLGLILVMTALMIAGPWLAMMSARLLARGLRGGAGLLAARRLADNPQVAFRAVSGLVLGVMVGTALAAIAPAAVASEQNIKGGTLNDVLRVGFNNADRTRNAGDVQVGLAPAAAKPVLAAVAAVGGTEIIPLYHPSPADDALPLVGPYPGGQSVVRCADLAVVPALGSCRPGSAMALLDAGALYTDNVAALDRGLPFVGPSNPATRDDPAQLIVSDLLVRTDDPATLERVRTALSPYAGVINSDQSPMTFGEVGQARTRLYDEVQRVVIVVAALLMLIAGSSLAVAVAGGLVERKRPFTLLRVSGTGIGVLHRTVLLETVLPMVTATVVAAGTGLLLAYPIARALAPAHQGAVRPDGAYYVVLGASLAAALAIVLVCLPILGRITETRNVRFE